MAGRPHTSWMVTIKNDLSYFTTSAWKMSQNGTGQTTLVVIGSKWSYTLNWCKSNNDDDEEDMLKHVRIIGTCGRGIDHKNC